MLTKYLVCILHAGLYIIKYLYILNSAGEIDFKFGQNLGRWTLAVPVIKFDAYPFLALSNLTFHLVDTEISNLFCWKW